MSIMRYSNCVAEHAGQPVKCFNSLSISSEGRSSMRVSASFSAHSAQGGTIFLSLIVCIFLFSDLYSWEQNVQVTCLPFHRPGSLIHILDDEKLINILISVLLINGIDIRYIYKRHTQTVDALLFLFIYERRGVMSLELAHFISHFLINAQGFLASVA